MTTSNCGAKTNRVIASLALLLGGCLGSDTASTGSESMPRLVLRPHVFATDVAQNETREVSVIVDRYFYRGQVNMYADTVPAGLTVTFNRSDLSESQSESTIDIRVVPGTEPGLRRLVLRASAPLLESTRVGIVVEVK